MKKFVSAVLCFILLFGLIGCDQKKADDIIIIYTSDVHCAIDDNIGYAGLVAYRDEARTKSEYVTMVDVGDAVQGGTLATVSKGDALVECLNLVNYDIQALGNHEFDYGLDHLSEIIEENNNTYINSNVVYTGKNENNKINTLDKYKIIEYGDTKVAYIALLTPYTLISASPNNLKEDGVIAVDFFGGNEDEDFYGYVQNLVDECKEKGADYVIALTHMGSSVSDEPYSSTTLATSTHGIDVIVDAHAHIQFASKSLKNTENKEVLVTSCGTELNSIGQISISPAGLISTTNIVDYTEKNQELAASLTEIKERYTTELEKTLFVNTTPLTVLDNSGIRVIRSMEMPIGDFVADAYRYVTGADIAIANGGGIRADLPAGDTSYSSFINVLPFGNIMSAINLTGQELLDYLEYTYRHTKTDYISNGMNNCEYGSFMQISGMTLTIDTSVTSDVVVDDEDNLISVGEKRRIKDAMVLNKEGIYEPIDPEKTYTVGSVDYTLINGGSGTEIFFKDKEVVLNDAGPNYDAIYTYARDVLNFDLSIYSTSANRILIK